MTEPKPTYEPDPTWWDAIRRLAELVEEQAASLGQLREAMTTLMQRVEALERDRQQVQRPARETTLTGIGETPQTVTYPPDYWGSAR